MTQDEKDFWEFANRVRDRVIINGLSDPDSRQLIAVIRATCEEFNSQSDQIVANAILEIS